MRTGSLLLALLALLAAAMLVTAGCTTTPSTNNTTTTTQTPAGTGTPAMTPTVNVTVNGTANGTAANTTLTNTTKVNVTAPFVNSTYRWIARAGSESYSVPSPDRYTIKFNTNGTYAIKADCNNGTGNFTVNATKVKINASTMATKTYCGDASLDKKFIAGLGQVTGYQIDTATGRLTLVMVNPNERLVFTKVV